MLVFRTREPIPEAGALPGDLILVDPDDVDHPLAVYRPLPADQVSTVLSRLDGMELLHGEGAAESRADAASQLLDLLPSHLGAISRSTKERSG